MNIKNLILSGIVAVTGLSLTSCDKWLDINVDPDSPTAESATYYARLAHCQFYALDAYVFAGFRNSGTVGDVTAYAGRSYVTNMCAWNFSGSASATTTPYQWFFVGCGSNLQDMYDKAMAAEAWHYAGLSRLIKAWGFMLMTDLYGEMPYSQALGESATPEFDTGKQIFAGALKDIDEAIDLLNKEQDPGNTKALAIGDSWAGGDINKWRKAAYLFKARFLLHLSKKPAGKLAKDEEGNYTTLAYDADEILNCLNHAQTKNDDGIIINHTDDNGKTHDVLGWDEPVDYHGLYSVLGMNSNYFVSKMLYDNLTNFDGKGIEDPRADHIIPWAKLCGPIQPEVAAKVKVANGWRRSLGVDMQDLAARTNGMPAATSWASSPKKVTIKGVDYTFNYGRYCSGAAEENRLGDTVYVHMISSSKGYAANKDLLYRLDKSNDNSAVSGSFHSRVSAPGYFATFAEACFIRAEVLFNKGGDKQAAFDAYKAGVKASIELMNQKLQAWVAEDPTLKECPSFTPMEQSEIDAYLNGAIGTVGDLTLAKIMTQKRLAMLLTMEVYNDARRYDYSPEVFMGFQVPAEYTANISNQKRYLPDGTQPRRWRQCSHELNYNSVNLQAIGAQVPGADMSLNAWNAADDVWKIPVWWDSDQK